MKIAQFHVQSRIQNKKYIEQVADSVLNRYRHHRGWTDTIVCDDLIYSHRSTYCTKETFNEELHAHEYYELLIYVRGDVQYITEDKITSPSPYSIIWFHPWQMHTGKLLSSSEYERHVFYFSPDFFTTDNKCTPILDFMEDKSKPFVRISNEQMGEVQHLLQKIEQTTASTKKYAPLLLKAYLIELFEFFNTSKTNLHETKEITDVIADVKKYIDAEYKTISSISPVANQFFYSREHLMRRFRDVYNISIFQYLTKKRILESLPLLPNMRVAEAAYTVGFHSQSAFIKAFKQIMGCLPSEYKARKKQ